MDEASADAAPPNEVSSSEERYPVLRATRRALLACVLVPAVFYYNADLVPLVGHTLIPFVALFGMGILFGVLAPRRLAIVTFTVWWVVVLASVLRRSAVADLPLGSQIFDGVLKFYPGWAVWFAELLRLGVYLWALWLGGKTGRRWFRRDALEGP